jgi:hypothetical protein
MSDYEMGWQAGKAHAEGEALHRALESVLNLEQGVPYRVVRIQDELVIEKIQVQRLGDGMWLLADGTVYYGNPWAKGGPLFGKPRFG